MHNNVANLKQGVKFLNELANNCISLALFMKSFNVIFTP